LQSRHYLPRALPDPLRGLAQLALDLRWSWHHGADKLWRAVDPELWEASANPWAILETVGDDRLAALAADAGFLTELEAQLAARSEHFDAEAWFPSRHAGALQGQVAYFSMEFGLSDALPIYSGGLGVLAGDLLKTACDLDVPVVGIGLLYSQGYFRQRLDAGGEQLAFFPYNDPAMLPLAPLRDDEGQWIRVQVELPGRVLELKVWHATVGRRDLLLLDSNDLLNEPGDRAITSELYGGGDELRLQQEIALGIGGARLLHRLGLDCPIYHLNEGHAAFAILERAAARMRQTSEPFATALRATRAGNLFTTHTPVSAGFDRFAPALFAQYFRAFAGKLGLGLNELLALGRLDPRSQTEPFNMAYLALRGAGAVNGVSALHGEVCRRVFAPVFPHWPQAEVPVGHVTNGVHVPTWDSPAADVLWTRSCGKARWRGELECVDADLRQVDDESLWRFRSSARHDLVDFLGRRLKAQLARRGVTARSAASAVARMDPDVLTIGFARRFAEYKRGNLLLHDPERLQRLLASRDRPVQLVIAGKAHPQDPTGRSMIRQWQNFLARADVRGRALFIEDYDLVVAAELTQGVDLWLNTPRRPWEACGTSGMKVLVNGGLNLSELDGWWAEAYDPAVGWALGDGAEHPDTAAWDAAEAQALYTLLETEVVPAFYRRDEHGLPRDWIRRMRESMARLTPLYSSNRMLREYTERFYLPMAAALTARDGALAAELEAWAADLDRNWDSLRFGTVSTRPVDGGHRFEVQVYLHALDPAAVAVELYADPLDGGPAERHALERDGTLAGAETGHVYFGTIATARPATDYTPRIVPTHPAAAVPLETSAILWYR
jgi:starch phosphorylase